MAYGRRNFVAYQRGGAAGSIVVPSRSLASYRNKIAAILLVTVVYTAFLYNSGGAQHFLSNAGVKPDSRVARAASEGMSAMISAGKKLTVATWNIAAINNNPFEYWITYKENPKYEELMIKVEQFLEEPGDRDVPVSAVFTENMFTQLDTRIKQVGWTSMRGYWDDDFKNRKIIAQFMKDKLLGSKRLASMPDRITNTINIEGSNEQVFRPTVINMYDGDLSSLDKWWAEWERFMFDDKINIKTKEGVEEKEPFKMLQPIKKAKYPDITEQEETDSLPLQTLCGAIFDAILVHMMNTVSDTPEQWMDLKRTMVDALNKQKVPHTLGILENQYINSDIITLQEVSSSFIDQAKAGRLGNTFHIVAPGALDAVRDQNSVIFLNKETFPGGSQKEITSIVEGAFPEGEKVPVANGDILAITATSAHNVPFVVASFHGDTNGLATIPVVDAIVKAMGADKELVSHRLVFGMDANTYENAKPKKQQDVLEFGTAYRAHGLTSCWGDVPDASNYTTYNARTYLQPQLNKACKRDEKRAKGDVNPKDFILFAKDHFAVEQVWKDNTGKREYVEDMAFPTLEFPSDHGVLSTVIVPKDSTI
ncbi:expressed unknown protein [Seminavis robusta]|uniref:Endonuclease/exonuclease/phosphatase domain-containing protein n=1 Tax=Seminavis robusta TaxID=568900 RepID=A0A9N8DSE1_9STRA|nr:expressed unknown protein [Seminavis robusta]|eukprot:Sro246_g097730.1 n/a (593) ;mRNA; r:45187-47243